jgi:serine/threonine protein kinase HipA of HipAB toxin-antitoxin module
MSETAEFPLPYDASKEERESAKREIAKYTDLVGEDERAITFVGEKLGQTGPVWHIQYTRLYRIPKGYLVAARDLHEGVKVAFAQTPEGLAEAFDNPVVREFIEDELRYRNITEAKHAAH